MTIAPHEITAGETAATESPHDRSDKRRRHLAVYAILAISCVGYFFFRPGHVFDDAYIAFRHSWNLARGEGLVFNAGEAVTGASAPLWTTILAYIGAFGDLFGDGRGAILLGAEIMTLIGYIITVCLTYDLARRYFAPTRGDWLPIASALVMLTSPDLATHFHSGMEAIAYTAMVFGTFALIARGKTRTAMVLATVAYFVRMDAVALMFIVGLYLLFERPRGWIYWPLGAGIILIISFIINYIAYGYIVPHSAVAKKALFHVPLEQNLHEALFYFSAFLNRSHNQFIWMNLAKATPIIILAVMGGMHAWSKPRARAIPLFVLVYGSMLLTANVLVFSWYLVPLGVAILLLILFCADAVLGRFGPKYISTQMATFIQVVFITILVASHLQAFSRSGGVSGFIQHSIISSKREITYRKTVEIIAETIKPGDKVAIAEIGLVAWELPDAYIVDLGGLCAPKIREMVEAGLTPPNRLSAPILQEYHPRFIVDVESFHDESADTILERDYRLLAEFSRETGHKVFSPTYVYRLRNNPKRLH